MTALWPRLVGLLSSWPGYLAAAALGALLAWFITDTIVGRQLSDTRASEASYHATVADTARAAEVTARAREKDWNDRLAAATNLHRQEMENAKAIEDKLRADVTAGRVSLRIKGNCRGSSVPGNSSAAPGGDASAIELSDISRSAYLALRASIIKNAETLDMCQAYVRAISPD